MTEKVFEHKEIHKEEFNSSGFTTVKNALSPQAVSMLSNYYWSLWRGRIHFDRDQVSMGRYADLMNESLLTWLQPAFESIAQCNLHPSFSHMRVYHKGSDLRAHKDRSASEFAVSISIDQQDTEPWPLNITSSKDENHSILLNPGDLLFYKGSALRHWREPFEGQSSIQVFLFYVDANGPFKNLRFDGRKNLGDPPISITEHY